MNNKKDYLDLQNGSDIRGIALEGIKNENINFTKLMAENIAKAFINFIKEKTNKDYKNIKIGIGNDPRLSANDLKQGAINGIFFLNGVAFDCGLSSTPSMFMSTILDDFKFDGAIMITASHLPFNRNGMKFFTKDGGLENFEIEKLLNNAYDYSLNKEVLNDKKAKQVDLIDSYSNHLMDIIKKEVSSDEYDLPLKGLHIVTNGSNGSGGFFANKVLEPLGANIQGSIYLEPNGMFPNHVPNPEDKKAMESVKKATLNANADLGIIFDTDVDRAAVVFSNGDEINKNALIALISSIIKQKNKDTTIVTDSVTSNYLTSFLEDELNLKHHRFKRGYKNVINEAIRLNKEGIDTQLAMETSGHGALKENYFLDDGAYLSVKIICELAKSKKEGKNLQQLIEKLEHSVESKEIRMTIELDEFSEYGNNVLKEFETYMDKQEGFNVVEDNFEGVRVNFNYLDVEGWMLLRLSLHDPILVLNIETNKEKGSKKVLDIVKKLLSNFDKVKGL